MFGLSFDIVPSLVTAVKWGSVILGLDMMRHQSDMSSMLMPSMSNVYDGFCNMRTSQFSVIFCAFFIHNVHSLVLLTNILYSSLVLFGSLFLLFSLLYTACIYILSDGTYNFNDDKFGEIILLSACALAELIISIALITCFVHAVYLSLFFIPGIDVSLISDLSYIIGLGCFMLGNYFFEQDHFIYDLMPHTVKEGFSNLTPKISQVFSYDCINDGDNLRPQNTRIT